MSVAACLLLYSITVLVVGPRVLRRLTRRGHVPRLGVAAWLTAIGSVLITWVAAAVMLVVDVVGHWSHPHLLIVSCLARLRGVATGEAGIAAQIVLVVVASATFASTGLITARFARTLTRLRARAHDHAHAVRVVGHRTFDHDVVVLDATQPAAYCVSGRPPAIVVTTGALATLDDDQLGAVLAHERAHLAGRHPHVVASLRSLATVFPRLTLMTDGAAEVTGLLEMCADDVAARRHGRRALLSGLLTLAGAAPAGALAAADVAVLERAERLAAPDAWLARARAHAALTSTVTVMAAAPLIIAALSASGVIVCGA